MTIHLWFLIQSIALTAILPISTAVAADEFGSANYYYGDIHIHTGISGDGGSMDAGNPCTSATVGPCGAIKDLVKNAKANSLDFVSITDHINGNQGATDEELFQVTQLDFMNANDPENGFITLPGVEFWFQKKTGDQGYGHKNMYFFADNEKLSELTLPAVQYGEQNVLTSSVDDCEHIWSIVEDMKESFGDILLIPHHPAGHGGLNTPWSCHNPTHTPSVEVYSQHGNSMKAFPIFDPLNAPGSYEEGGAVEDAIHPALFGHKIGFFSSTDNHSTTPGDVCSRDNTDLAMGYGGGLAVVMLDTASSFTRLSIYEALISRKTYATSGPMLPVKVNYSVDGVLFGEMGDVIKVQVGQTVDMTLLIPEDHVPHVTSIVVRYPDMASGEKGLWLESEMSHSSHGTWTASFDDPPLVLYPTIHINGDSWYGKDDCDDGGLDTEESVWVSPTWFNQVLPTEYHKFSVDTGTGTETQETQETSPTDLETGLQGSQPSKSCGGCNTNILPFSLVHLAFLVPMVLVQRRSIYVHNADKSRGQN
jgi:hypothetical protein